MENNFKFLDGIRRQLMEAYELESHLYPSTSASAQVLCRHALAMPHVRRNSRLFSASSPYDLNFFPE